ncbi:MAG: PD-(D/E)XK nuclease family protein, partial [Clostridia bacterium]|nr:PD-(D/E)XK nuclease family protein [Clostridia bacterium]
DEGRKTDTLSTVALKLKQENDRKSEQIRLLYVAMTRARQHLFVSGKPSSKTCLFPDEPNSFAGWIAYAKSHNNNLNRYFVNPKPQEPEITEDKHTYYPMEAKPVLLEKEYPHMASTKLSCKYSVSSLGKKKEDPDTLPAYTLDYQNDSHTDNILLGTAYHAILQYANFTRNTPEEVNLQIKHLLDTKMIESLPHGFDYAVMHKAFANPRFAFLSLGKCYREQPFMLYVPASKVIDTESNDSVLVQGVIDFLSVGKEAVLIDYKYTRAPLDIVRARYQKQLDIYTLAAEKALGIRIDRREIYLIGRDEFVLL